MDEMDLDQIDFFTSRSMVNDPRSLRALHLELTPALGG
jgi:hypothetical protein